MAISQSQVSIAGFLPEGDGLSPVPSHHPYLKLVDSDRERRDFKNIVNIHHSYVPETDFCGRSIKWLILDRKTRKTMGVISIGSAVIAMKPRDLFIGWHAKTRRRNLKMIANNTRFCLIGKPPKNFGSQTLGLMGKLAPKYWNKKYGDSLCLLETLVEPPHTGSVYKGAGWILVGKTKGCEYLWISKKEVPHFEKQGFSVTKKSCRYGDNVDYNRWKIVREGTGTKKKIFVKPLQPDWKINLLRM